MTNVYPKLILSQKPTGNLLCRYYTSDEKIGYFVIRSNIEASEKIKLASDLFIIGAAYLKMSSVSIYDIGGLESIFFIPKINLENLVEGFVDLDNQMEKEYFYIEPFKIRNKKAIEATEAVYYNVRNNTLSISCQCYSKPSLISMPIKFEDFFV